MTSISIPLPVRLRPIHMEFDPIGRRCVRWVALARPTWSSTPHSPAEGFAAFSVPLLPFSLPGRTLYLPSRQDLLLSRTVISRQEVALRGPFRLRLASACLTRRPRGVPRPAPPRG